MERDPIIKHAATNVGGVTKLSTLLGLSRAAVSIWRRVPAERVLQVEGLTGVPRHDLRPDLYPREPGGSGMEQAQPQTLEDDFE